MRLSNRFPHTTVSLCLALAGLTGCSDDPEGRDINGDGTPDIGDDGATGQSGDDGSDGGDAGDGGNDGGGDDGGDGQTGDGGDGMTGDETGGGGIPGEGTRFDLGVVPDGGGLPPSGSECTKVDFLFVIDNSGSMADEQENLINSFGGFISGIQTTLEEANDYHIGVVTTDEYGGNPSDCQELGALVTQTTGQGDDSSDATCTPYAGGNRFMTQAEADLAGKFACAAKVGTGGHQNERPLDAARTAASDAMTMSGACNDGFLRDDALLVLVLITDEEDDHELLNSGSDGDPPDWFDDIVAAKSGIETNVVVLSLVGGGDEFANVCEPFDGITGAEHAARLIDFTQLFTHGFLGDVCAENYDTFFDEAISVIDAACKDFTPPG